MPDLPRRASEAPAPLKVGQLAARTGLSVRTLHYYDEIGLLHPSGRTPAGHRLYFPDDVARLQQITSLRELGMSLEQIGQYLADPGLSATEVVERHLALLEERMRSARRLKRRLERIKGRLRDREAPPLDELIRAIEETTLHEKYFSEQQLSELDRRGKRLGKARMEAVQAEWQEIFEGLGEAMRAGVSPDAGPVRSLALKAQRLVHEFTAGDARMKASLDKAYRENQGALHERWGIDAEVAAFYGQAMQALAEADES